MPYPKGKTRNALAPGTRFSRLTVVADPDSRRVRVRCDCGLEKTVQRARLVYRTTLSCGCLGRERRIAAATRHSGYGTQLFWLWHGMRQRCENPRHRQFRDYGGRGIRVCDRWHEFAAFREDMGERPSRDFTLERIDNGGPYAPGNCRWATRHDQSRNTRRNRTLTFRGVSLCLRDWAARAGMSPSCLTSRLKRGWSVERALTEPPKAS